MWDYTEKVKDHFLNPRNTGKVEQANGTGEVGSLACGDALTLTLKINSDQIIEDAKFQTFGCASAIASSSALTEMVMGMHIDEASKITNEDIADYLGGLPKEKIHCSVMGRDALERAISDYRGEKIEVVTGNVICHCFGVTDVDIERAVKEAKLTTIEEVTDYLKAGGGCGNCHEEIEAIIRAVGQGVDYEPKKPAVPAKLTNMQKIKLIEKVIEEDVRPGLQKDHGDMELIDVDANRVIVKFRGACASCSKSQITLKNHVEAKLRELVSMELTVEEAVDENRIC
ncbi:MAG: Fe-S cluster assembly protein NifU [Proteobacteria bacterium]|nr:Fe-S cluster assembly protein NifU [Pseudomonadota bacterium]